MRLYSGVLDQPIPTVSCLCAVTVSAKSKNLTTLPVHTDSTQRAHHVSTIATHKFALSQTKFPRPFSEFPSFPGSHNPSTTTATQTSPTRGWIDCCATC